MDTFREGKVRGTNDKAVLARLVELVNLRCINRLCLVACKIGVQE